MKIQIIKPGIFSTIQDMGRFLFRGQGVPVSGVMDPLSAQTANIALGNSIDDALIEFTYADAVFKTQSPVLIAYSGDGAILMAGELHPLPPDRPVFVPAASTIKLKNNRYGSRTYVAVAGGWDVPLVMSSRSTYATGVFGGYEGRTLKAGDILSAAENSSSLTKKIFSQLKGDTISYPLWAIARSMNLPAERTVIRIIPGPELNWFDGYSINSLLSQSFTLDVQSNRMGYQLNGPGMIRLHKKELLSTAVTPGTIQVTGNGSLILLMADCQTTGGYPRVAQVAAVDMPLCGQLKPGDQIVFKEITHREAEHLYIKQQLDLQKMRSTILNRYE